MENIFDHLDEYARRQRTMLGYYLLIGLVFLGSSLLMPYISQAQLYKGLQLGSAIGGATMVLLTLVKYVVYINSFQQRKKHLDENAVKFIQTELVRLRDKRQLTKLHVLAIGISIVCALIVNNSYWQGALLSLTLLLTLMGLLKLYLLKFQKQYHQVLNGGE